MKVRSCNARYATSAARVGRLRTTGRTNRRAACDDGGFTLIEVVISTAIVAVLSALSYSMFKSWTDYQQRAETLLRLNETRDAMTAYYRQNAMVVERDANASLVTGPGAAIVNNTALSPSNTAFLAGFLRLAQGDGWRDGYGNALRVFVSAPQVQNVEGVNLQFRRIALVSAGPNAQISANTTFDTTTGILTIGGDDTGVLVDGLSIQRELLIETRRRVQRLAQAIYAYAQGRFYSNPSRDASIDYFASAFNITNAEQAGRLDKSPAVDPTTGQVVGNQLMPNSTKPIDAARGFDSAVLADAELLALGVTRTEAVSAWGGHIRFFNATDAVRSPLAAPPQSAVPPYTAQIAVDLPALAATALGGVNADRVYSETLIGAF